MTTLILMLLAASAVLSLCVLTGVLVRLGSQIGTLDSKGVEGHEKTLRHVPNIGGITIWAMIVLPLAGGLIMMQRCTRLFVLCDSRTCSMENANCQVHPNGNSISCLFERSTCHGIGR